MLTLVATAAILSPPARVTDSVGGFSVQGRTLSQACRHDSRTGHYLLKQLDCDGAHVAVVLTRDRNMVEDWGYDVPNFGTPDPRGAIEAKPFPLETKNGIRIGMTVAQVEGRIGRPDRVGRRGASGEFLCYLYRKITMEDKENGYALRNTYVFKGGRLIEVQIHGDSIPGCGQDGLSEEGWPWGRFGHDR
jgi:hypothetical protein